MRQLAVIFFKLLSFVAEFNYRCFAVCSEQYTLAFRQDLTSNKLGTGSSQFHCSQVDYSGTLCHVHAYKLRLSLLCIILCCTVNKNKYHQRFICMPYSCMAILDLRPT